MKKATLLVLLVAISTLYLRAEKPTLLISEDFSSVEWADELLRIDPNFVRNVNTDVNIEALYFDKYKMAGTMMPLTIDEQTPTFECALFATEGIIHTAIDDTITVYRLKKAGDSYMEFPELPNAGAITIHARNGNPTNPTTLSLQQYVSDSWVNLNVFDVQPRDNYKATSIDEILTFNINTQGPIRLRISRGDIFVSLLRVDITAYTPTDIRNLGYHGFKLNGRKLTTEAPTQVTIFNILGKSVFETFVEQQTALPASIEKGIYIIKGKNGIQKILLNH